MRRMLAGLLLCCALQVQAAPGMAQHLELDICFNYGCLVVQTVSLSPEQRAVLVGEMLKATDAAGEREQLEWVIARLYRLRSAPTAPATTSTSGPKGAWTASTTRTPPP
jgi:hypothetical protein